MLSCACLCLILLALLGLLWCYASSQQRSARGPTRSEHRCYAAPLYVDGSTPTRERDAATQEVPEEPFAPPAVSENPGAPLVDLLANGATVVPTAPGGQGLAVAEEIIEANVDVGGLLEATAALPRATGGRAPPSSVGNVAQEIEQLSVEAAVPAPPKFEPLALDVLPQKYWQPTFPGCQSTFTDARCDYYYPTPRLWVPDLQQLQYARSLEQGRTNLIEPLRARQALAQLLSIGVRTRKDVYTQASPSNDIASQNVCAKLASATPSYVRL